MLLQSCCKSSRGGKESFLQQLEDDLVPRIQAVDISSRYNYEWEEALEAVSMVRLAKMVASSALKREESRGHHWRTDFPNMRQEWEKHTIIRKKEDDFIVTTAPVIRLKGRSKERSVPDPKLVSAGVIE